MLPAQGPEYLSPLGVVSGGRESAPVPLPVQLPQDLELGQDDRLLDARGCRQALIDAAHGVVLRVKGVASRFRVPDFTR